MKKREVIVIGAGAAGLMAALKLSDKFSVTILESQNYIGGRIKSVVSENSIIETGAEFIHGHVPVTLKLLKKAGIKYVLVKGKMYKKENGHLEVNENFIEGWDELLKKMKKVKKDITMKNFLDKYYSDPSQADFYNNVTAYTEGFDIADVNAVSVKSLYKEWAAEDEVNYRIPQGYGLMIDFLQKECIRKGCSIMTSKIVKQIDWHKNDVIAWTKDGEKYHSNKLIVTVPVSILQTTGSSTSISFSPGIDDYTKAAKNIGFGSVVKVIFHFEKPFWNADAGFIFSDEALPTWWTQLPDNTPILTGWAGGNKAENIYHETDGVILEKAFASLSSIFDISLDSLKQNLKYKFIYNWKQNVNTAGAYSYATPLTGKAVKILRKPILNTIFFAGEALYKGKHPGTVEAALVSGKQVAKELL